MSASLGKLQPPPSFVLLDDHWFQIQTANEPMSINEILSDPIKPGRDRQTNPVHEGLGVNGIKVRGRLEYADSQVPSVHSTTARRGFVLRDGESVSSRPSDTLIGYIQFLRRGQEAFHINSANISVELHEKFAVKAAKH